MALARLKGTLKAGGKRRIRGRRRVRNSSKRRRTDAAMHTLTVNLSASLPSRIREAIEIERWPNFNRDRGWNLPPAWKPCLHEKSNSSMEPGVDTSRKLKTHSTALSVCNAAASALTLNMQEMKISVHRNKVDTSCQQSNTNVEYYDGTEWQIIDDIDKYIQENYGKYMPGCPNISKAVHIAEMPRVKIIAEKYSRYKQNNVELRKLDEKVVCVEYDVFDRQSMYLKPFQVMRAFFSIKPIPGTDNGIPLTGLPSALRNKFDITFGDLQKLSEKEVEIIDGKIAENQPYLDDLRKILRYKQMVTNSTTLDLQTLYEIANTENFHYGRDTNLLSKVELQEVKDLILKTCRSSVYGFNRRTVQPGNNSENMSNDISQSIICELLRKESDRSQ